MMTDQDVRDLYRCLLGRPPENEDTIKAFQHYYPDFARGRQAVFCSEEFEAFHAEVAGRKPAAQDIAAALALALLERVGSAAPPVQRDHPVHDALRDGLSLILGRLGAPLLAVVVGEPDDTLLEDLLPLGADDAVLQVAPGFPPAVPLVSRLACGATLFRLTYDKDGLASFLASRNWRIGALFLAGRPADAAWVDALRGRLAEHALVAIGQQKAGPGAAALSAEVAARHPGEPVLAWSGLHLHCYGGWPLPVTYAPPASVPDLPPQAGRPTLAIAAIMRDEAACIVNMLRSVQPVASFCALLDTGSSDGTPDLARGFLRDCGMPHAVTVKNHDDFEDRFGEMRNAALDMVPREIDWVLMLDADEEMEKEDYALLFALMARGDFDAYALPRYNFRGHDKSGEVITYPDRQIRLLRNRQNRPLRYSGAVHETIRDIQAGQPPLDASALGGDRGGPHIHHLVRRFRDAQQEERKQQFYRDIAERHSR